jgi:hypothetical protein
MILLYIGRLEDFLFLYSRAVGLLGSAPRPTMIGHAMEISLKRRIINERFAFDKPLNATVSPLQKARFKRQI